VAWAKARDEAPHSANDALATAKRWNEYMGCLPARECDASAPGPGIGRGGVLGHGYRRPHLHRFDGRGA